MDTGSPHNGSPSASGPYRDTDSAVGEQSRKSLTMPLTSDSPRAASPGFEESEPEDDEFLAHMAEVEAMLAQPMITHQKKVKVAKRMIILAQHGIQKTPNEILMELEAATPPKPSKKTALQAAGLTPPPSARDMRQQQCGPSGSPPRDAGSSPKNSTINFTPPPSVRDGARPSSSSPKNVDSKINFVPPPSVRDASPGAAPAASAAAAAAAAPPSDSKLGFVAPPSVRASSPGAQPASQRVVDPKTQAAKAAAKEVMTKLAEERKAAAAAAAETPAKALAPGLVRSASPGALPPPSAGGAQPPRTLTRVASRAGGPPRALALGGKNPTPPTKGVLAQHAHTPVVPPPPIQTLPPTAPTSQPPPPPVPAALNPNTGLGLNPKRKQQLEESKRLGHNALTPTLGGSGLASPDSGGPGGLMDAVRTYNAATTPPSANVSFLGQGGPISPTDSFATAAASPGSEAHSQSHSHRANGSFQSASSPGAVPTPPHHLDPSPNDRSGSAASRTVAGSSPAYGREVSPGSFHTTGSVRESSPYGKVTTRSASPRAAPYTNASPRTASPGSAVRSSSAVSAPWRQSSDSIRVHSPSAQDDPMEGPHAGPSSHLSYSGAPQLPSHHQSIAQNAILPSHHQSIAQNSPGAPLHAGPLAKHMRAGAGAARSASPGAPPPPSRLGGVAHFVGHQPMSAGAPPPPGSSLPPAMGGRTALAAAAKMQGADKTAPMLRWRPHSWFDKATVRHGSQAQFTAHQGGLPNHHQSIAIGTAGQSTSTSHQSSTSSPHEAAGPGSFGLPGKRASESSSGAFGDESASKKARSSQASFGSVSSASPGSSAQQLFQHTAGAPAPHSHITPSLGKRVQPRGPKKSTPPPASSNLARAATGAPPPPAGHSAIPLPSHHQSILSASTDQVNLTFGPGGGGSAGPPGAPPPPPM